MLSKSVNSVLRNQTLKARQAQIVQIRLFSAAPPDLGGAQQQVHQEVFETHDHSSMA